MIIFLKNKTIWRNLDNLVRFCNRTKVGTALFKSALFEDCLSVLDVPKESTRSPYKDQGAWAHFLANIRVELYLVPLESKRCESLGPLLTK